MLLIEIQHLKQLIDAISLKKFFQALTKNLTQDFKDWNSFQKSPRHAIYVEQGVIELMPIANKKLYSFKYVNGHPGNTKINEPTIFACGMLAETTTGKPLLVAEMTLLTALRTAATAALASSLLAKPKSKTLAIIGCGAQSEFQVLAHHSLLNLTEVHYFDIDPKAMKRFAESMKHESFKLIPGKNIRDTIRGVDIIVTATAVNKKQKILNYAWIEPGQHICGIGGDSPGKTELDIQLLKNSKIVVEYFPQTVHEGEIQNLGKQAKKYVHAELWQIISGKKAGRKNSKEITLYDCVGFALEDYSALRLVYELATRHHIGVETNLIPTHMSNSKDLFSLLTNKPQDKNTVTLLGYAAGIAANNPDCGLGPIYLNYQHHKLFKGLSCPLEWQALLQPKLCQTTSPKDIITAVADLSLTLAQNVEQLIKTNKRFCVLGGDHSSAIGTWSGAAHAYKDQGDLGMIWIDAHMDSHTPETSETGNIHGMPAAVLLGHGLKNLKELMNKNPKLKPENLCFIGIRSYESGEAMLLKNLGVKIFFMEEILAQGLDQVFQAALHHVNKNTCGFGLTIDLDAIDPTDAPGVGCREKNGIPAATLLNTLKSTNINYPFVGLEISEYNPLRDEHQKTAQLIALLIETIYGKHSKFVN